MISLRTKEGTRAIELAAQSEPRDKTYIEWTDATWNVIVGCSLVCPAARIATQCATPAAERNIDRYRGVTQPSKAGPVWTGEVRPWESWPRIRCIGATRDGFRQLDIGPVPRKRARRVARPIFGVMAAAPQHTFQALTKRAERRLRRYVSRKVAAGDLGWPLPNLRLGVSVEDRARLVRVDHLRGTPAAVRFLSLEPLLEDLGPLDPRGVDWVIVGGESGRGARPMYRDWARRVRDQCVARGGAFFFQAMGEWAAAPST